MKHEPFQNTAVAKVFDSYPKKIRQRLLLIRQLIFNTAATISEVGEIDELLKWGEPSYLTTLSKSGSTIRLGWKPSQSKQFAIYFNCKTTLIDSFKKTYGTLFQYEGNRGMVFDENEEIPKAELRQCIILALTYHLNKKKR